MASATSSQHSPDRRHLPSRIAGIRELAEPLRRLAAAGRSAPLLYLELTGLDSLAAGETRGVLGACKRAVSSALRQSVGSVLRKGDAIAAGPGGHWFAALLADRRPKGRLPGVSIDAELGMTAARLSAAARAALAAASHEEKIPAGIGVRGGWTVIEPVDASAPLEGLRHAVRGAAVVARVEEQRALMLAALNHELRTPLTSIVGYVERLRDDEALTVVKRRRYLDVVAEEARRLHALVEELIDVGSWAAGNLRLNPEPQSLRKLVDAAWLAVAPHAETRRLRLLVRGEARLIGDRQRLLQVFINCLDNAVRHARDGGSIAVRISAGRDRCGVAFSDDGRGFDPKTLQSIGVPFGRGPGGRVGLGLAICRFIVEAHGGAMSARNRDRGGARLDIRLPTKL